VSFWRSISKNCDNGRLASDRRFGVSTHLFHEHRLTRDHLVHIAAHGFETVEVFATRSHFDYHDAAAVTQLAEWLADTRLELHSIHAPIVEAIRDGQWMGSFSNASGDDTRRKAAVAETAAVLNVRSQVPFRYVVLHLGIPVAQQVLPGDLSTGSGSSRATSRDDNQPDAARRSVEDIVALAANAQVKVALEVMPNPLSSAGALVRLVEEQLEGLDVGICLDYGHANLMGDLGEAVETLSGHLWTTHVHDNGGKHDDHLVPYAGRIDWDAAMMETQKIGYDGVLMFEVKDTGDPVKVLQQCVKARERLEKTFVTF
jgi:sugar phosphate isomerase/epimerase